MKIFFVGLTGSGKTTLGKKLANKLGIPFVDLDDYIVKKESATISEIFASKGEAYFRELEAKCLREVCRIPDIVVSTGGGAACFHDNMAVMNVSGITIFLDVPVSIVTERLWNQPHREQRPMIANRTKPELQAFLNDLLQKRVEFYDEAKLIVSGDNITIKQILEDLESWD